MKLHGKIVAADATEKTITIECDTSISGVQVAGRVILIDEWPEASSESIQQRPERLTRKKSDEP